MSSASAVKSEMGDEVWQRRNQHRLCAVSGISGPANEMITDPVITVRGMPCTLCTSMAQNWPERQKYKVYTLTGSPFPVTTHTWAWRKMVASLLSNKPVCTCRQQASRPALRRQQHPTHAASVPVPRSHRLSRRDVVTRAGEDLCEACWPSFPRFCLGTWLLSRTGGWIVLTEGEDTDFEKRLGALDQGSTQGKGFGKVRPKKSASEPDTPGGRWAEAFS